jgi:IS605 OrfB family transposase
MVEALSATADAFAKGCNLALEASRGLQSSNKVKIQQACYRRIRDECGLSANLAIRAIARVAYAVKVAAKRGKRVCEFRSTSIDYDQRIFDWREHDETVSITTVNGRIHIPLKIGGFQRDQLSGKKPTCARVVKTGKDWDVHIAIEETEPPKKGGPPLGIDLGINSIAAMSNERQISGRTVQAKKSEFARIRASLQSKGTRGAKQLLRRLSGRERRYIRWVNHNVSKSIVQQAVAGGFGIIRFENLKGIRERTKSWNKHRNRMLAGWSFGELQTFSEYKAIKAGLITEFVNPYKTSVTCHKCKKQGHRDGKSFSCATCGDFDADTNAAKNIAAGGVGAGEIPAVCNATQIVEFFAHSKTQSKAAGL